MPSHSKYNVHLWSTDIMSNRQRFDWDIHLHIMNSTIIPLDIENDCEWCKRKCKSKSMKRIVRAKVVVNARCEDTISARVCSKQIQLAPNWLQLFRFYVVFEVFLWCVWTWLWGSLPRHPGRIQVAIWINNDFKTFKLIAKYKYWYIYIYIYINYMIWYDMIWHDMMSCVYMVWYGVNV